MTASTNTTDALARRMSRRLAIAAALGTGLALARRPNQTEAKRRARRDGDPDAYALEGVRDGSLAAASRCGSCVCWPWPECEWL